jgi:hypothetical protein
MPFGEITGPCGIQRVYAVLSAVRPDTPVHSRLEGAELHRALDDLAAELSKQSSELWRILSYTIEVRPRRSDVADV